LDGFIENFIFFTATVKHCWKSVKIWWCKHY